MRPLLFLLIIVTSSSSVFSQSEGIRYGFYFGAGMAKIKNAGIESQLGRPSFNAGIISNYQITNNFGLVAGLLFISKGSKVKGTTVECCQSYPYEETYKLYYAEVPIMIKGSIQISNLYIKIFSGPSVNYNLKSSQTRSYQDTVYNKENGFKNRKISDLNFMELSWVSGAGFEVILEEDDIVFLEIKNNLGLTSFGIINERKAYNNYFSLGIGYLY